jgi:hypothetical protein
MATRCAFPSRMLPSSWPGRAPGWTRNKGVRSTGRRRWQRCGRCRWRGLAAPLNSSSATYPSQRGEVRVRVEVCGVCHSDSFTEEVARQHAVPAFATAGPRLREGRP